MLWCRYLSSLMVLASSIMIVFVKGQGQGQMRGQGNAVQGIPGNNGTGPPPHPLSVAIAFSPMPNFLMLEYEEDKVVQFNYSLQCDHRSTRYVVMVKSTHPEVASIEKGAFFNVSCAKASFGDLENVESNNNIQNDTTADTDTDIDTRSANTTTTTVSGFVNVTFKSSVIGRSFLLLLATKISGPPSSSSSSPSFPKMAMPPPAGQPPAAMMIEKRVSYGNDGGNNDTTGSGVMPNVNVKAGGPMGAAMPPGMAGRAPPGVVMKGMILVIKSPTIYDELFRIATYVFIVTATTCMGMQVDWKVIRTVLKKPLAPAIGLFAQYLCMPLIAFAVTKLVPQPNPAMELGIFTCGIVPGGGASNFYCYLLGGDVSLSVTMTVISSIASIGLIPFWLYTLGDTFKSEMATVHVPFLKILETLALVVLPIFLGMIIRFKIPKVAKVITKFLKPTLLVVLIVYVTFACYLHVHIFKMIKPQQILAGCLLPYCGYVVGGVIAFITRRPWTHIKTIAIETGIQNVNIAFLILFISLPPPDNLLAIVSPAASSIMTPLPLLVVTTAYIIYNKCKKNKDDEQTSDGDGKGNDDVLEKHANGENGLTTKDKKKPIFRPQGKSSRKSSEAGQKMLSKESKDKRWEDENKNGLLASDEV